ncbi:uncharacterized protein LOC127246338 isoform X2 [Andrographis paniculata]|uniref:uncharacterized protein LOC127246338 isoform X2 n=1 Tax=Andrographis paniculata TaxID=175694 RepID=UPI0021E86C2E|nr:uncharacterized protein LOC127246338 isoform X2 [Andrographis paniculata]
MDSDDDYGSFAPSVEASPQAQHRTLKRLKKADSKPSKESLPVPDDDPLLFPHVDFARLEALENDSEFPELNDLKSTEEVNLSQESLSEGIDDEKEDNVVPKSVEEVKKTKRVLEFDSGEVGGEYGDENSEGFESKKSNIDMDAEIDLFEEKKDTKKIKKNRLKSDTSDYPEKNARRPNKRREEKERKAYLEELHAESQRLLRETRDASFKPTPVVHKPISSVLEKIRKRKIEVSKKAMAVDERSYLAEESNKSIDNLMEIDESGEGKNDNKLAALVQKGIVGMFADREITASEGECKDSAKQTNSENDQDQEKEEPISAFRAPADDTEDLFDDTEPNTATSGPDMEQANDALEEDSAPSLLPINLKFDSVPMDDSSSDEEDNDKENVEPHPSGSSPRGDPVKDFVDDEAEEEDDSDNDLNCLQENGEDEDIEDFEELNDMIATGYEEKPSDNERRNELHQKWLEQQDAAGTDKIMQRLGCDSGLRDALLKEKESESDEENENDESDNEAREDSLPQNPERMNIKKAKQIILNLLSEKEDGYYSDDDHDKQRKYGQHIIRNEERPQLTTPADDESSREVFGLIKKMNIASDQKKKPKPLSFFDSVLKGGSSNSSSKSSFLGRMSNQQAPSSHRQGSGTGRHFIFGRDDSNSRSSFSLSEDSSDTVSQENRQTRAKYSSTNSQPRFSSQATNSAAGTSLFEILKRPAPQPQAYNQDTTIDLTKSIFTFRASKRPMKIEGRG